jgi:short-subunit dehydrogenase
MTERRWRRALISGASSGIGAAFARHLAPACEAMTLVARRAQRLEALARELRQDCAVDVLVADLATTEGQARVSEHVRQHQPLDLLVNNAGFSTHGPFAGSDLDAELAMVTLHQTATLTVTRAALPYMCAAGRGAVINVASVAAYLSLPAVATYAGSKAFLAAFSRALAAEVSERGIRVQCLCPGYTRTEIHSREAFSGFDVSRVPDSLWMDAAAVVRDSIAALDDGPVIVVPGAHNRRIVREALRGLADQFD